MAEQGELSVQVGPSEQVDLTDEGHQVAPTKRVGLMAVVGQVVPDNQVDLEEDHNMDQTVKHLK